MTTQDSVVYWKINRALKNSPQDNLGQLPTLAPIVIQNQHRIAFRMLYGRPGTIRFIFLDHKKHFLTDTIQGSPPCLSKRKPRKA